MESFKPLFRSSLATSAEIGSWGADHFWKLALGEEEQIHRVEGRLQRDNQPKYDGEGYQTVCDADMKLLKEAIQVISNHHFCKPTVDGGNLSQKVLCLRLALLHYFERPSSHRCIVFVSRRSTARLLSLIFQHPDIGGPHLRPGLLTGLSAGSADMTLSFRKQIMTMQKFRKGEVNCLVCILTSLPLLWTDLFQFATSVAEEGLDIPDCNMVIRYLTFRPFVRIYAADLPQV
jgi:endoribonuclease Dicer